MVSVSSKVLSVFLDLFQFKKLVEKSFVAPKRSNKYLFNSKLREKYMLKDKLINDKYIFTLDTSIGSKAKHILFFHGGAYLIEGSALHRKLVETLANKINCRISYIDYPLAPENNYKNTFDMVQKSYNFLTETYAGDEFIFMGDSAGGGLALAFAQKLVIENAHYKPTKIILFSPWLDITMQNSAIKQQEKFDKILPMQGLIQAGLKYAGGDNIDNYLLSPIQGDLNDLGDILVFYGTHELFYPDCKVLETKSKKSNSNFTFCEFPEMQHDWVLLPIPEAKQAINIAIEFINKYQ